MVETIIYLHRDKDSNWELAETLGLTQEQGIAFSYMGLEVQCKGFVDEEGDFYAEQINNVWLCKPTKL
jgi:hypothetical protein